MMAHFPAPPLSADDLLVLLAVARTGRYTSAGQQLGLNHTTIARRITALEAQLGGRVVSRADGGWELTALGTKAIAAAEQVERALGDLDAHGGARIEGLIRLSATDGFSGFVAAPAMAELQRTHPDVRLEIVTGTRQASQQRAGADLEVVVGRPQVRKARAVHLADYALGLYASRDYLRRHPTPARVDDLAGAPLVYFIESMLHVDSLDDVRRVVPGMTDAVASTNVYVHVDATRGGAGFGLLPAFLADPHDDLVRVLPDAVDARLPYWLVARPDALRQPAVMAFLDALQQRLAEVRPLLLGQR
ncbi:LysR family transcriptional regulator [Microbacterium sp. 179-I 3D3 NHS]|uniref:LysR family transcriptional regulator n=1 Tax=Microbacterium sp. 179-I 3D3 NHS TaxID=3142382 RepID=UPI00399F3B6B